jgi:formylmethanofuran--tetrahydromethanopterin N-formyltransferase
MSSGRAAVQAIEGIKGVYTPFPGGLVGSGSKPQSKYKGLVASTNELYCPTIRAAVPDTAVPEGCEFVMEIVVNGLDEKSVGDGMKTAIKTVCTHKGVLKVSAGNFGGSLGVHKIKLHNLIE